MSSSIDEIEKRTSKFPSNLTKSVVYARDAQSLVFSAFLRSDRVIDLAYEIENNSSFILFYKRIRDKLRKMVAKCLTEVSACGPCNTWLN